MTWATLAHVGNDWLAVPIAVWLLVAMNLLGLQSNLLDCHVGFGCSRGRLSTKAYFLAFVPLLLGLCACAAFARARDRISDSLRIGRPMYARNLVRYGVLSERGVARRHRSPRGSAAAPALNWPTVIWSNLRAHSGRNNTFSSFSASTLNLMLGISLLALLLWRTRHGSAEWITVSFCALFALALGYQTVVTHIHTHGVGEWAQRLVPAGFLGAFAGSGAAGRFSQPRVGNGCQLLLVLLFGYVLAATYAVKLIRFTADMGAHVAGRSGIALQSSTENTSGQLGYGDARAGRDRLRFRRRILLVMRCRYSSPGLLVPQR